MFEEETISNKNIAKFKDFATPKFISNRFFFVYQILN